MSDTFYVRGGKYLVEKEIGKGSFATVYRGHATSDTKVHIAVKAVARSKLKNKKLLENLEVEIAILKKIKHPHIVGLIDCERTSTDFYLVMEYCALGDLTFLIKKRKELEKMHPLLQTVFKKYPPPSEKHNGLHRAFVICYLQQLASALKFLRSKNLVHRDLKPQNLLLATPMVDYHDPETFHKMGYVGVYDIPILKIADFGFARFLPSTSMAETLCGSPLYMAPEILNYQKYNAKADLWSVGTVLYEMCCGIPPFTASNHLELFKKIKRAHDEIYYPDTVEVEEGLKALISSLLTFDPTNRITFEDFFENKLVNEDLSKYELVDEIPELESKSKDLVQSNLFVSEFLSNKKSKSSSKNKSDSTLASKNLTKKNNNELNDETQINNGVKYNVNIAPEVYQNEMVDPGKLKRDLEKNDVTSITNRSNVSPKSKLLKEYNRNISDGPKPGDMIHSGRGPGNSDSMIDKEYVVVDKKNVEVNSLADDVAQAKVQKNDLLFREASSPNYSHPQIQIQQPLPEGVNVQRALSSASGGSNSRRASLVERRLSISSLNPSNALTRALGLASTRLFGGGSQPAKNIAPTSHSPNYNQPLLNSQIFYDLTENLILRTDTIPSDISASTMEDNMDLNSVVRVLEALAAKAFVVYSYAEVKYSQIIPLPLSVIRDSPALQFEKRLSSDSNTVIDEDSDEDNDNARIVSNPLMSEPISHKLRPRNDSFRSSYSGKKPTQNRDKYSFSTQGSKSRRTSSYSSNLSPYEITILCKEAVILYMKSLEILAKSMKITSKWWYDTQEKVCSLRLNVLVQWIREKFNECLDKADYLRMKLEDSKFNKNNGTPNEKSEEVKKKGNLVYKQEQHTDADGTDEKACLEKLLYDRALEISRYSANLELQGQNLSVCELGYATALWMLNIALENNKELKQEQILESDSSLFDSREYLDPQDKLIIEKYINSISTRLKMLRQKMLRTD